MFCFAWIAYLTFASILSLGRHQMRRLYAIEGSGIEDICAAVFLYPQTPASSAEASAHMQRGCFVECRGVFLLTFLRTEAVPDDGASQRSAGSETGLQEGSGRMVPCCRWMV